MAHNDRTQSTGTWTGGGYVVLPADMEGLDTKVFEAVNGDQGGAWAPALPIVVADSAAPASSSLNVTGPTLVTFGGNLETTSGSRFLVDPTKLPKLGASHPNRTRSLITPCVRRQSTQPLHWITTPRDCSIRSIGCSLQIATVTSDNSPFQTQAWPPASPVALTWGKGFIQQPQFVLPLRVHDGARMTKAELTFRIPGIRLRLPVATPRMRVVRIDAFGNVTPLKSTPDGTGYVSMPMPSSPDEWMNGGLPQTLTYACDQNNVIDKSQYYYEAQVVEEIGTYSQIPFKDCDGVVVVERKIEVQLATTTNIALTGSVTVDGLSANINGMRILVKNQTSSDQNGIWMVNTAGAWQRAADNDQAIDFSPNFIVAVIAGTVNAKTVWQLQSPTSNNAINLAIDGSGTAVAFRHRVPNGNIFHAIKCAFDQIVDMRFQ